MNMSAPLLASGQYEAMPKMPQTIEETGLTRGFLLDLLIKTLFRHGMERPSRMAAELRLSARIIVDLIELAREKELVFLLGQPGANMNAEMRYQLTAKGRDWALQALERDLCSQLSTPKRSSIAAHAEICVKSTLP